MIKLQAEIQEAVADCCEQRRHPGGFSPHLSVGQALGKDAVSDLLTAFQEGWKPLVFRATEISPIYRGDRPDDVFRVDRTVNLGKR